MNILSQSLGLIGKYLNFTTTTGSSGYGLRDNSGNIEYKDVSGSWTALNTLGGSGSSPVWDSDQNILSSQIFN